MFQDFTKQVMAKLDKAASRAMTRTGMELQGEMRKSMKSGGSGPPGRRPHAAPGQPPNVQSGKLRSSIDYDCDNAGLNSKVRVGVPGGEQGTYGAIHEMGNHPFIKPVIKGKAKLAQKRLQEELGKL